MADNSNHTDLLAKWLAGNLSAEEEAQLSELDDLEELRAVSDDIASWQLPPLDTAKSFTKLQEKKNQSKQEAKVISMGNWMRIAASVALLITAFFGWDYFFNNTINVQTEVGEKKELVLPDGSKVTLDVSSSLAYNKKNWDETREVELTGQAYFDVESGNTFTVNSSNGSVEVLGTQFNISQSQNTYNVACFEGSVKVYAGIQEEVLKARQGVNLTEENLVRYEINNTTPNWVLGFSKYDQVKLSQVVKDLQQYYEVEVDLPTNYQEMLFTGQFEHGNLETALRAVFVPMEIEYTINSQGKVDFN